MRELILCLVQENEIEWLVKLPVGRDVKKSENGAYYVSIQKSRSRKVDKHKIVKLLLFFDEKLFELFEVIFFYSLSVASKFSNEPIESSREDPFSTAKSLFQEFIYQKPESVFHLAADVFIDVAMAHRLTNGNKRLAFAFMVSCLYFFGLDFFGNQKEFNYSNYAPQIALFVDNMKNRSDSANELQRTVNRDAIVKWIGENCLIAPNGFKKPKIKGVKSEQKN